MNLRKGKKLLNLGRNELLMIEKASNDRINGIVLTDKGEFSADFIARQLDFGFMRLLPPRPPRVENPRVGTVVMANHSVGNFQKGSIGVCYELYKIGDHEGASFFFDNRFYDGFATNEYKWLLEVGFSPEVSEYKFENVVRLERDYIGGFFDSVFKKKDFTHFYKL